MSNPGSVLNFSLGIWWYKINNAQGMKQIADSNAVLTTCHATCWITVTWVFSNVWIRLAVTSVQKLCETHWFKLKKKNNFQLQCLF